MIQRVCIQVYALYDLYQIAYVYTSSKRIVDFLWFLIIDHYTIYVVTAHIYDSDCFWGKHSLNSRSAEFLAYTETVISERHSLLLTSRVSQATLK
jgi:hypothetical protein